MPAVSLSAEEPRYGAACPACAAVPEHHGTAERADAHRAQTTGQFTHQIDRHPQNYTSDDLK